MMKKDRVTAADVAKQAGVSRWTVTRSFLDEESVSEPTRLKVKKIAEEMGYLPNLMARSLIRKQSGMIAIVVDNFMNYYVQKLLREVSQQLQQKDLLPVLINIEEISAIKSIKQAEQFQVDGIIFLGSFFNEYLIKLAQINNMVPLIVIGRDVEQDGVRVISIDNYQAGSEIAALLLALKYRTFGYVGGQVCDAAEVRRYIGYRDTVAASGHTIHLHLEVNRYDSLEAYKVMHNYLQKHQFRLPCEALFCENDTLAIGVLDALKQYQLDKKVAVVGFDNVQLGESTNYQLTSYDQDVAQLAKAAIKMIYHYDEDIYIQGNLVLRQSHLIAH